MYIAIRNDLAFTGNSLYELCMSVLQISINHKGQITINGEVDTVSYGLDEFTKQEALIHWCNTRAIKKAKRFGVTFYKATQL